MNRMSERERRFVNAYLHECDGNASKAAISAGYSEATAAQQGSRLLRREHIQHALQRVAEKAELSTAQALQNVSAIACATPDKVNASDVLKANELILRVKGALNDKQHAAPKKVIIGFFRDLNFNTAPAIDIQVMPPRATVGQILPSE